MLEAGFQPDFPPEVVREVQIRKLAMDAGTAARDLRSLLWSSIDNDSSRDLDQVEYVEKLPDGTMRLLVGIADVDASVAKGSATDLHAGAEATSVYTGVTIFPMLPGELSMDRTSLLDEQDRRSMVIELQVLDSGEVTGHDVYPAWLRNRAKLAYSSTGAWLEGRGPIPSAVAAVPGMEAQLRLQQEASERLQVIRKQHGSLTFGSVEATPVLQNGEVTELAVSQHTMADDIIENFMVAANVAMAQFLKGKGSLSIRRVVKIPKRWDGCLGLSL
jgi:VacB/RNase II family 3'-5' exoribonuclease